MGCGASKAENGGDVVPARFRPLLRCRFEVIKTRNASAIKHKGETLSKKQLLRHGQERDGDSPVSLNLPEPEMTRNKIGEETNVVDVATPRSARVAPEPEFDDEDKDGNNEMTNKVTDFAGIGKEEALVVETDGEEDEEEGRLNRNVVNGYICPRSPSFRVYCIDQSCDDSENESKDNEEADMILQLQTESQSSESKSDRVSLS